MCTMAVNSAATAGANKERRDGAVVKNPPANTGDVRDMGLLPGSGRSPGEGSGNLLQYSCLENSMDRGASRVAVHGVTNSWTRRSTLFVVVWGEKLSLMVKCLNLKKRKRH